MGIVRSWVVFDGKVPDLSLVAEKMTEISTLAVSIYHLDPPENYSSRDLDAYLAFACAPKDKLRVYTYTPNEFLDRESATADIQIEKSDQEPIPTPKRQGICLEGYVGQESTIWHATLLALEALGGQPVPPIPKDIRQKYGRPITVSRLKKKRRTELVFATIFWVLALPVMIPLFVLHTVLFSLILIVLFPFAFVTCLIFQKRIENAFRFYAKSNKKGVGSE